MPIIVGLALFYGGLAQLTAGMWEFKKANTLA
jgi:succinate-acetate transporter protein